MASASGLDQTSIYTPVDDARRLLEERRCDRFPPPSSALEERLQARPYAVLYRQVATPNFEMFRFLEIARRLELQPLVVEHFVDKFVTWNPAKLAMARMAFHAGTGRRGGSRLTKLVVADQTAYDGKRLDEVRTVWGESLIDFHHVLLGLTPSMPPLERFDGSAWFSSHGGRARSYYPAFLSMFVQYGVLVESFLETGEEAKHTFQTVIPAFEEVTNRNCGRRPLIAALDPPGTGDSPYWLRYPADLRAHVMARRQVN